MGLKGGVLLSVFEEAGGNGGGVDEGRGVSLSTFVHQGSEDTPSHISEHVRLLRCIAIRRIEINTIHSKIRIVV